MADVKRAGGFKALRFAGLVALAGFGVAAFLVVGSYLFWQAEKKSGVVSQRELQDLRARLETIKRERDEMKTSEETYKNLIARGAFVAERRLDLIDMLEQLKRRHNLLKLEYEIAPQRPLRFATGASYPAVSIMASRIHIKAQAYHDGELVAFLDEFPRTQRGFFPMDKCSIARIAGTAPVAPATTPANPLAAPSTPSNAPIAASIAHVEADCTLEWITLADKHKPTTNSAGTDSQKRP